MDWQKLLTQAGYRISKPRKQVMQLLENTQTPQTALAIYQKLKAQGARSAAENGPQTGENGAKKVDIISNFRLTF